MTLKAHNEKHKPRPFVFFLANKILTTAVKYACLLNY